MDMPTSALTGLTLKDLFDAGLHFGHQTKRWNPKMKPYIFDKRNGIHIIDLTQTVSLIDDAAKFLRDTILAGKKVLFVATKKQAQEIVKAAAVDCGQFYVTERWLGGTLTNNQTIRQSVRRMHQIETMGKNNNGVLSVHKQEASVLRRELSKLQKNLTGLAEMDERPGAIVIVDVVREINAVREASRLGIPIIAITDTNADPDPIDYVIPGNDDSVRGIELIINGLAKVVKSANDEYSRKAAEEARQHEAERAARETAEKAARAARREKEAAEKAAIAEKTAKEGLKEARAKAADKAAPAATGVNATVKAAAKKAKEAAEKKALAEEAKAKEALAAARAGKAVEAAKPEAK